MHEQPERKGDVKNIPGLMTLSAMLVVLVPFATAHFRLLEPASALVENNLGDPQKLGPCGGTTANPGMPSGMVTKAQGGQNLHIKVQETVFHPGHYRVALARTKEQLPADPQAATRDNGEKGPWSVSAPISNPVPPGVLADGLFVHTAKQADPWETDIMIPNFNCDRCVLQITQFMAEHGYNKDGGYFYHHCADLQITADASKPVDQTWSKR
jgi:hypothetical protein